MNHPSAFVPAGAVARVDASSLMLVLLFAFLILAPVWAPALAPRMYDNSRLLELGLLVLLACLSCLPPMPSRVLSAWAALDRPARMAIVVLAAGAMASAALSDFPKIGAQQAALTVLLLWAFLCVAAVVRTFGPTAEEVLAAAVCAGAALVVVTFWSQFVLALQLGRRFSWVSPFLDFANVRFFGQYQAYCLLLMTLPLAFRRLTASWRAILYIVAANFWALQWMVGSRAVWVGTFAALAVVATFARKGRWIWLCSQVALVLAGGAIFHLFSTWVLETPSATAIPVQNSLVERGTRSASERVVLAKESLQLIARHPLTGVGPGQFVQHYTSTNAAHPHNTPLQLLSEYGIPAGAAGIALGAILVVFAVRELRRRTASSPDYAATALAAALVMGLVDSLFSGNLIMPHSQVLLLVIAGWIVGRSGVLRAPAYVAPARLRAMRMAFVGTALLAATVTVILAAAYVAVVRDLSYPPHLRVPSFWQYARFTAW
jgi:O-antigen ligase